MKRGAAPSIAPTRRWRRWTAFLAAAPLVGLSAPSIALAAPDAISTVACAAGDSAENYDVTSLGPLPFGLSASCDAEGDGYLGGASVQTDFGPGIPQVGSVTASASARATGLSNVATGAAGGSVSYFFEVKEIEAAPFPAPVFPIYMEGRGEGTLNAGPWGSASFSAVVLVPDAGVILGLQSVISSDTPFASFNESARFDLAPNTASQPFYTVELLGACEVFVSGGGLDLTSTGDCEMAVDPLLRFDQETFDARYGENSYRLTDYYEIVFSANLPEASNVIFASGFEP